MSRAAAGALVGGALLLPGGSRPSIAADASSPSGIVEAVAPFLGPPRSPDRRVIVVGWDGATYNMIDPMIEEGRLPHVRALIEEGVSLRLESTMIPISSAAWVSAVTGKGPGKTGVLGFFGQETNSYDLTLISSRDNRAAPIWRILNHLGRRTHIVGVPVTYPPEPIDGVMIAGMLSPRDAVYTHPPALADRLRRTGFVPALDVWRERDREPSPEILRTNHDLKTDLVCALVERSDWDLLMVVYKSLDVLSHRAYRGDLADAVAAHHELLDDALGRIRSAAGPDTDILLLSDHGFGVYYHKLSVNRCLAHLGLLSLRSGVTNRRVDMNRAFAEVRRDQRRDDLRHIDMRRTVAYCELAEGNFAGIRLNVVGREPEGIVAPAERDSVTRSVMGALAELRSRSDGKPVFTQVVATREIYPGPWVDTLPEILVRADRRLLCDAWLEDTFIRPLTRQLPEHRRMGVLIAAGPSIAHRETRAKASILDITPTLLHLYGLPALEQMDGDVLVDLFRQPAEVKTIDESSLDLAEPAAGAPRDPEQDAAIYERLRALGYLGGVDAGAGDDGPTEESPKPDPRRTPE
jgi:predicted AlkP superfamily phosphohydrolase/phosphomutase